MEKRERTFTTFQAADVCNVRPTTIIKWANQGRIKVYTTPGGHRRICHADLLEFMNKYSFPIPSDVASSAKRVLILEDEADLGQMLVRALKRASDGLEVQWTKDGVEGLIAVGKNQPDLVILDVVMPLVDGAGVLATLRSDPATRNVKIIGMTGKRLASEKLKYMQEHTDGFFYKPFKIAEMAGKVLELLKLNSPAKVR